jgi:hypothetical protein
MKLQKVIKCSDMAVSAICLLEDGGMAAGDYNGQVST